MKAQAESIGILFIVLIVILGVSMLLPTTQQTIETGRSQIIPVILNAHVMCQGQEVTLGALIRECGAYCACRDTALQQHLDRLFAAYTFTVEKDGRNDVVLQKGMCTHDENIMLPDKRKTIVRFGAC